MRHDAGRLRPHRVDQVDAHRARTAAHVVDRAEALGDEQPGFRTLALDRRVGRDGRAVREEIDVRRLDLGVQLRQRREARGHRARRIGRDGRNLRDLDLAGLDVHPDHVGERSADIDAYTPLRHARLLEIRLPTDLHPARRDACATGLGPGRRQGLGPETDPHAAGLSKHLSQDQTAKAMA
jgi:hypothetical protein